MADLIPFTESYPYKCTHDLLMGSIPDLLLKRVLSVNLSGIFAAFNEPYEPVGPTILADRFQSKKETKDKFVTFPNGIVVIQPQGNEKLLPELHNYLKNQYYPNDNRPKLTHLFPTIIIKPEWPDLIYPGLLCEEGYHSESFIPVLELMQLMFVEGGHSLGRDREDNCLDYYSTNNEYIAKHFRNLPSGAACLVEPEKYTAEWWKSEIRRQGPRSSPILLRIIGENMENLCLDCPVKANCNFTLESAVA